MFQIARGSGATLSECTFSSKKCTSPKYFLNADHFKTLRQKEPGTSHKTSTNKQSNFKTRSSSYLFQIARGSGATPSWMCFFLQKGTHHSKISGSALWFHSRKHSDDTCFYSARPKGTRRGFQSSTMKCSGACRCETHGIPCKEERRSSLTRFPFL